VSQAERRARQAHRSGLRAGNAGRPADGARLVRAGLAALGWRDEGDDGPEQHRALAARLVITLAHLESELGRADYGLALLARAERSADPADRGIVHSQRGLILMRKGRWTDALSELAAAEPLVGHDPELLARVLLNRGVLHLNTGAVRLARGDLRRAAAIAESAGLALMTAKATQNLGYCDLLGGDIPAALGRFDLAARTYRLTAPGVLPSLETDRARALLAAGLADDAAAALDAAIAALRRQRRDQHLAEAELARAQAAQLAGDLTAARRWAGLALRRFRARGNHAWAALAELTRLGAAFAAEPGPGAVGAAAAVGGPPGARRAHGRIGIEAEELAGRLHAHGLPKDAEQAALLAARAFTVARRRDDAVRCLAAAEGRGRPLEIALLRRLARAELAAADGRTGAALAELRAGLATLHNRRGQLGSLDLQTGTAALGAELAGFGLRLALGRGTARHVFWWLERSRAQSFRVYPVRPPGDPEAAAVLAELRQLGFLIRTAELSGDRPDPAHLASRAELQRQVRQRSWRAGGRGQVIAPAGPAAVATALAESGQALASIAVHDRRMLAVTIGPAGQPRLVRLGDFGAAAEAALRLTADLDALAGRRLPPRLEAVIRESVRRQTLVLEAEVVTPLLPALGRAGVVIVPVGALASVPWGMLPGLRGRPVTVSPSASSWLTAWRADSVAVAAAYPSRADGRSPVLVAGPGLRHAVPEVSEIAAGYPGCRPLVAAAATVEATLRALDGAPLAHLAAHGHHDRENVLFSRLDLADGPLMAYDVQRLPQPPRHVVLSACDVGRTVVRPGDEILGFTAALLHLGTATVISSVSRVDDETALAIMTAYHRALSAGLRPAEALAQAGGHPDPNAAPANAALDAPLTPFVCFGAG
jgi:tetratricopeptide (TPR) repeat protein